MEEATHVSLSVLRVTSLLPSRHKADVTPPIFVVSPSRPTVPATAKVRHGLVVATPMFPPPAIWKYSVPVDDATENIADVTASVSTYNVEVPSEFSIANAEVMSVVVFKRVPVVPETERSQLGEVVPMPPLPVFKTVSSVEEAEFIILNADLPDVCSSQMVSFADAVEVPRAKRLSTESHLRVDAPPKEPPLLNWISPELPAGVPPPEDRQVPETAKHPPVRLMPFANVEVAVVVETVIALKFCHPPTKVEVAVEVAKSDPMVTCEEVAAIEVPSNHKSAFES